MKPAAAFAITVAIVTTPAAATEHPCTAAATSGAAELLAFHVGEDDRIAIDPEVRQAPPLQNPANPDQQFDVLEVWGDIYKGRYRMRFIYAQRPGCVLMGQEILEYADL